MCGALWHNLPSLPCQFSIIFEYMGHWQSCFISVNKNAKKQLGQYPAILTSRLVNNAYWKIFLRTMNVTWLIASDLCQFGFHFHFLFLPSFLLFLFFFCCFDFSVEIISIILWLFERFFLWCFRVTRQVMFTEILKSFMVKSQLKEKSQHLQQCHPLVQKCFTLQRLKGSLSEERIPQAVQTLIGIVLSGSIPLSSQQSTKRTKKRLSWIVMSLLQ